MKQKNPIHPHVAAHSIYYGTFGMVLLSQIVEISNFPPQVKLFNEKRADLEEQQLHLNVGLQKIRETVEQVEELQKSLSIKRNELEDKNNMANAKLKQMVGFNSNASFILIPPMFIKTLTTTTTTLPDVYRKLVLVVAM